MAYMASSRPKFKRTLQTPEGRIDSKIKDENKSTLPELAVEIQDRKLVRGQVELLHM